MVANAPTANLPSLKKPADVLLAAGTLSREQHDAVLKHVQQRKVRAEEAILELGLMNEADLLKALAAHHKTQFITAEKLARAEIPRATLDLLPRKVAERFVLLPVLFDAEANVLSVVTADPDNLETIREVALVSGARDVRAILARPAALKAGLAKHYAGDRHAFATFEGPLQIGIRDPSEVTYGRERMLSEGELKPKGKAAPPKPPPPPLPAKAQAASAPAQSVAKPPPPPSPRQAEAKSAAAAVFTAEAMLEMLNVFVSLLENGRNDLRGHSAAVARFCKRLADRVSLPKDAVLVCSTAGFVHDLGKMGQYHLTALNASEYDGHKLAAQKACDMPVRLLEAVRLPAGALTGVKHMYERYDGRGFPDGLTAKEIPIAARILAIVDTFADLTQNARNPYRKMLSPAEALTVLDGFRDTIFDPYLLDLFRTMLTGEDVRARLLESRSVALIVDADPEETTVLELRMLEQGFEVKIARTIADAMRILAQGEVDLVVSEAEMPGGDGLALLADARKQPWGKDLPWVIHTRKQGRSDAQRAFELGVLDYASKLSPTDVLVAKLKALLAQRQTARAPRGVSGNLLEMGLSDLIQVLWQGQKTGVLKINTSGDVGEVHFEAGNVINARWGQRQGAEAFYAMLKLKEGDFAFDPAASTLKRVIQESTEALLLEGMRRLDEGIG